MDKATQLNEQREFLARALAAKAAGETVDGRMIERVEERIFRLTAELNK